MINRDWILHRVAWLERRLMKGQSEIDRYYDKEIHDINATNQKIRELILEQKPFMVGRFGSTELNTMVAYQKECNSIFLKRKMNRKIKRDSGFFGGRIGLLNLCRSLPRK